MRNDIGAPECRIEFPRGNVDLRRRTRGLRVRHHAYAIDAVGIGLADEDHVVLLRPHEMADQMQILAGKVLVDEQELHVSCRGGLNVTSSA